jgi:hypothetical protein
VAENVIRINIARDWTASEFSELMSQLQFLADVALFSKVRIDGQSTIYFPFRRRRRIAYYDVFFDPEDELRQDVYLRRLEVHNFVRDFAPETPNDLRLSRLEFASPGFADLAGVGKIVEQLRIFLMDVTDRYLHKGDREIARESAAQDLLAKKIANAEAILNLGEKIGLTPESKQILLAEVLDADYFIEGKVLSGQITSVESSSD